MPVGTDAAAYRIVQEALTNVARHAGPTTATVRVNYGKHDLTVQVDDDGRGPAARQRSASGNEINGLQERVTALGAELHAGPAQATVSGSGPELPLNGSR